jgi:Mg2+/Co2+ transporter CorB
MLGGVLDLSDMDVAEVMVHRKSIDDRRRPADPRAHRPGAGKPHTRLPLYPRRSGEHRRRAAR